MTSSTLALLVALGGSPSTGTDFLVERISTRAPFPRGLQLVDGELYVLCRGRVREYGGVSAEVEDQAGTLYALDPDVAETYDGGEPGDAVRENGRIVALPTAPPFRLWDRTASPPTRDRETDRPYCGLSAKPSRIYRFHPDPKRVHDARGGKVAPYIDLAALTGNPEMKSENALVDEQGRVYVTSGDAYAYQGGAGGVVWRVTPPRD